MKIFMQSCAVALGLLTSTLTLNAAQLSTAPLQVGAALPAFSGRTITNRPVAVPEFPMEKPAVLVFTFSRKAGKDAKMWNEHLAQDFAVNISAYGVNELESAPKIFRRLAISGIKSSISVSAQDRTIVLYRDEQLWRQRLGVKDENRAYVVLLDRSAAICWMSPAAFSDGTYGMFKAKIAALFRSHP
jgi:hypothetical protein